MARADDVRFIDLVQVYGLVKGKGIALSEGEGVTVFWRDPDGNERELTVCSDRMGRAMVPRSWLNGVVFLEEG